MWERPPGRDNPMPSHSRDLRKGRFSEEGRIYLLTTATWERVPLFSDMVLGRVVVQAMRFQEYEGRIEGLAFVVMPDHLHWLVALQHQVALSAVMKSVKITRPDRLAKFRGNAVSRDTLISGKMDSMIALCARKMICWPWPGISLPTRYAPAWWNESGITLCGMQNGCSYWKMIGGSGLLAAKNKWLSRPGGRSHN